MDWVYHDQWLPFWKITSVGWWKGSIIRRICSIIWWRNPCSSMVLIMIWKDIQEFLNRHFVFSKSRCHLLWMFHCWFMPPLALKTPTLAPSWVLCPSTSNLRSCTLLFSKPLQTNSLPSNCHFWFQPPWELWRYTLPHPCFWKLIQWKSKAYLWKQWEHVQRINCWMIVTVNTLIRAALK